MTYNIHHGANKEEKNRLEEMGAFIKQSGADLVGLQEVDSVCRRSGGVDQMKKLGEITGMYYAFVRHFAYQGGAYGQGILSRYPISDIRNNRLTLLKKDSTRQSTALISAIVTLQDNKKILFASAHYALDDSTRIRQAAETISYLNEQPYQLIFTGDLNAEPGTKEIHYLDQFLTRTDTTSIPTYPAPAGIKTIDYIYIRKGDLNTIKSHITPLIDHSDHLPVISTIVLKVKKYKRKKNDTLSNKKI